MDSIMQLLSQLSNLLQTFLSWVAGLLWLFSTPL